MSNTESKPKEYWIPHTMVAQESLADAECVDPESIEEIIHVYEATPFVKKAVENHAAYKDMLHFIMDELAANCDDQCLDLNQPSTKIEKIVMPLIENIQELLKASE